MRVVPCIPVVSHEYRSDASYFTVISSKKPDLLLYLDEKYRSIEVYAEKLSYHITQTLNEGFTVTTSLCKL